MFNDSPCLKTLTNLDAKGAKTSVWREGAWSSLLLHCLSYQYTMLLNKSLRALSFGGVELKTLMTSYYKRTGLNTEKNIYLGLCSGINMNYLFCLWKQFLHRTTVRRHFFTSQSSENEKISQ